MYVVLLVCNFRGGNEILAQAMSPPDSYTYNYNKEKEKNNLTLFIWVSCSDSDDGI